MRLSQREMEICKYNKKKKKNIEIAKILYLSEHTIKSHVSDIIANLGAVNRTQVAYILGKENIIKI